MANAIDSISAGSLVGRTLLPANEAEWPIDLDSQAIETVLSTLLSSRQDILGICLMNCRYFNFILILGRIKIEESPAAFDVDAHILPSVASILSLE